MKFKKGEMSMTETLTNITEFLDTYETEEKHETPRLNAFIDFVKLKNIANEQKELINEYIVKDKNIRNGKPVIKGTRITPQELLLITQESFNAKPKNAEEFIKYIKEQYPSIDSVEKIVAGLSYSIRKCSIIRFLRKMLSEK